MWPASSWHLVYRLLTILVAMIGDRRLLVEPPGSATGARRREQVVALERAGMESTEVEDPRHSPRYGQQ